MPARGDIGQRIAAARESRGWTKSELGRKIGKSYRMVQKWETGDQGPDRESLALLSEVLGVTLEELLGVAEGQDPPFAAWHEFLATPQGQSMTPGERRMLQSIVWPGDPPLAAYMAALMAAKITTPRT
jgi:transcriptional regulator with XRE-family HTH domain